MLDVNYTFVYSTKEQHLKNKHIDKPFVYCVYVDRVAYEEC